MKIALAQIRCTVGDVRSNCARIVSFATEAASLGCRAVVFPEMCDTGYVMLEILRQASSWSDGPLIEVGKAAGELGITLICGLSERENDRIYNSVAVLGPGGSLLGKYRKMHLFSPGGEDRVFCRGSEFTVLPVEGAKCGFSICYDLRFPELFRGLALRGAEVLVNSTAWPEARAEHWLTLARARAIENQAWFAGANRVGTDGKMTFAGRSLLVDPGGRVVAQGSRAEEELVIGEIDLSLVPQWRKKIPVLDQRREDIYGSFGA